ncbi:PilN domain-containing protein [Bacillus sp. T33-2]|uniref:PilN domain-containing protein n=1 Tax=Bacillus sp. T33-2 TaxID=2054168 RepID=UPI000C75BE92|nr:fimbrial protein [Bacillus sp. T33-2]PLR93714.1 fimbrial protein [Bacillus sp. T33-2]
MLVEINLLPKKEPKHSSVLLISIIIFIVFAALAALIYWQANTYEKQIGAVDKELATVQKLNMAQQKKLADNESLSSAAELQKAAEWAQQYPVETVPILRNIISLLPERGFIQFFQYANPGTVNIRLQFDTTRDAAYYLNSLKESEWVENADLLSITAQGEEEKAETEKNGESDGTFLPRYTAEYVIDLAPGYFTNNGNIAKGGEGS